MPHAPARPPGRIATAFVAALGLACSGPALAAQGDVRWGAQAGPSIPTGEFDESVVTGFQGGLTFSYMESENVGIGLDFAYHQWGGSDEVTGFLRAWTGSTSRVELDAVQVTLHALYDITPHAKLRPYAKAGFGMYFLKAKVALPGRGFESAGNDQRIAYSVGAGVNLVVSPRFLVGLGGTFQSIQTVPDTSDLFTIGFNVIGK